RDELEPLVQVRVERIDYEVRAEDVVVLDLVERRRASLIDRGVRRASNGGAPSLLALVSPQVRACQRVIRQDLEIQLAIDVLESRLVREVRDGQEVDLLATVRAPEPQPVFQDRSADLDSVVLDTGDLAADEIAVSEEGLGPLFL